MNNETIEPRSYLKLLLLAALLGLGSAVITFIFMALVQTGQMLLWEQMAAAVGLSMPIFTVLVCTIGGLLVGVAVRIFGDHSGIFAELMLEFGRNGRFNYQHAPGIVVTAFVSLVAGGSLGPEAPMADACGSLGTWLSDKLKLDERSTRSLSFSGLSGMLAAFITSPFGGALLGLESARTGMSYPWTLFPSLVASAVATTVFVLLTGAFFGHLYVFPEYTPHVKDLLLAVPLGLLGALAGAIFIVTFKYLRQIIRPLQQHLIARGVIGGVALGVVGALLPLTLFSGEDQTLTLIDTANEIGVPVLIAMALVKLFITSLLLVTGWKGGYIFPTMFASVALGMAAHLIFPSIPVAVAVAATMGGAMVATMKAPLFSALFTAMLMEREAGPVIAIAVIVGLLATARLSMAPTPPQSTES
ncbi:MAG TPA: chloride channel protein [Chloroflexota bacterium]|nr:chloride channel protein [Chloroflexota bacterium]HUM70439.1 chloride channel protein [Chloroflexota bacterium]